uniref:CCHC-type domain-containing protein n=1 Tax=Cannabis sativa TaxID=3483 RepID=A0A803Q826_CANSA
MAEDRVKSKDVEVEVIDEGMNQVLQRDSTLEMEMLELFEDITLEDVVINKACVGKVVGCKDMPASIVKNILLGVWRRLGPWRMKKCENGVMGFFFEEEDDCAFVLENRPWLVNGVLLNLKPWPVEGEVRVAEFEVASFWVQFHGLPTRFLKDENAAIVGKKVGSFLKTDSKPKEELVHRGFLRAYVDVWLRHPIPVGFFLTADGKPESWIQFKYEKLPHLCFNCGKLAHWNKECSAPLAMVIPKIGEAVQMYGTWIKSETGRSNCFTMKGKGITKLIVDNGEVPEWELNGKHRRGVWRRRQPPRATTTKAGSGLEAGVTTSSGGAARYPGDRTEDVAVEDNHIDHVEIEGVGPNFLQLPNPDFVLNENRDIIPNIGPTIAQSLEIPHEWVCLSQTPHKFPKPTPLGWPNLEKEAQEMFLKLYGDDVINLYKAQQFLISNPPNLSEMILFLLGNTRKRKVHTWYEPYPADSLASSSNKTASEEIAKTQWTPTKEKFCIGSGGEASNPGKATTHGRKPKGKEDNRSAKRSSGVKTRSGRRRGRDAGDTAGLDNNNEVLNNCIEVNIEYERTLRGLIRDSNADFLFLSETKVTVETMVSFQAAIGFPEWKMYCIYGTPYGASKREFWSWLTEKVSECNDPWALVGDLNVTLDHTKKIGGRDYDAREGEFLRNFLFKCGGIDLGSVGGIFTWKNSRLAPNCIRKRLDRVIADGDWCTVFSNARDEFAEQREMGLPRKFCRTKRELKLWNQNVFGFCDRKLRCLRNQLESVQKMAITQSTVAKEAEIQMEILDMEEKMGRIWRQKSRENLLRDDTREWLRVWKFFQDCFQAMFCSSNPHIDDDLESLFTEKVTESENEAICRVPDEGEIKDVVFKLHPLKAPGPDEFPCIFFRKYWDIIGVSVCWMVQQFFLTGRMQERVNETFISLIPNIVNAATFDKFRPISLCNFGYKIISRILTDRLKGCMDREVLSKLILRAERNDDLNGIRVARNTSPITHLFYANDSIFFCSATVENASSLLNCLHKYERWSGQHVSNAKSGVVFSPNTRRHCREEIKGILGINNLNPKEKYLGNPFFFSANKRKDFLFLKDKILGKLEGWKAKNLSQAGRTTLVSSVLQSILNYFLSSVQVPTTLCEELDRVVAKFWWVGSVDKKHYSALRSWSGLCQPKRCGGLGFRRFKDMNLALLAKLCWMVMEGKDKPWVKLLRDKYCKSTDVWDVEKTGNDSRCWRSILQAKAICVNGAGFMIADGSYEIWDRPWLPRRGFEEIKDNFQFQHNQPLWRVVDLFIPGSRQWNEKVISDCFSADIAEDILRIRILDEGGDVLFWKAAGSEIDPRLKHFCWKLFSDLLPTKSNLGFLQADQQLCDFCHSEVETAAHLFFNVMIVVLCNSIWKWNNDRVFKGQADDLEVIYRKIIHRSRDFVSKTIWFEQDASISDGVAGFAAIQINDADVGNSLVYLGWNKVRGVLEGELLGIALALWMAKESHASVVKIETDSLIAATAFGNAQLPYGWDTYPLFRDCLCLCKAFDKVFVCHVNREHNVMADALTRWARVHKAEATGWGCKRPEYATSYYKDQVGKDTDVDAPIFRDGDSEENNSDDTPKDDHQNILAEGGAREKDTPDMSNHVVAMAKMFQLTESRLSSQE